MKYLRSLDMCFLHCCRPRGEQSAGLENAIFDSAMLVRERITIELPSVFLKADFTRYNFVSCDMLTTSLRHESFRVNPACNLLAIVAYNMKNVMGF